MTLASVFSANAVANAQVKNDDMISPQYITILDNSASGKNGVTLAMSESRNINILCDYRLKATFTAGSESTVVYKYPS